MHSKLSLVLASLKVCTEINISVSSFHLLIEKTGEHIIERLQSDKIEVTIKPKYTYKSLEELVKMQTLRPQLLVILVE